MAGLALTRAISMCFDDGEGAKDAPAKGLVLVLRDGATGNAGDAVLELGVVEVDFDEGPGYIGALRNM